MKKISKAVCIALTLCLLLSALLALAACDPSNNTGNNHDPQIDAVYQKYVAYAEALGEEPLSYEQWLESVKGPQGDPGDPGKDGATWLVGLDVPANTLGKNGDLYLNTSTLDLYLKSDNAWSIIANIKGTDGEDGDNGADGATWLVGTETPADTLGKNGDFYLNKTTFELYLKSENTWSSMGVIKGSDGKDGDNGKDGTEWFTGTAAPAEELGKAGDFYLNTKSYELYKKDKTEGWESLGVLANNKQEAAGVSVTIEAGQTATVSLDGVEQGLNTVIVDLGEATLEEGSNLQAYIGDSVKSDFYLSSIRSGDGHNVYFGYVDVTDGASEVTLSSAKAVTASVSFEKYNVTIKSGEPFECAFVGSTAKVSVSAMFGDDFTYTTAKEIGMLTYKVEGLLNGVTGNVKLLTLTIGGNSLFNIPQESGSQDCGAGVTSAFTKEFSDKSFKLVQTMPVLSTIRPVVVTLTWGN